MFTGPSFKTSWAFYWPYSNFLIRWFIKRILTPTFSEYLLETRFLTSANYNIHPYRFFYLVNVQYISTIDIRAKTSLKNDFFFWLSTTQLDPCSTHLISNMEFLKCGYYRSDMRISKYLFTAYLTYYFLFCCTSTGAYVILQCTCIM